MKTTRILAALVFWGIATSPITLVAFPPQSGWWPAARTAGVAVGPVGELYFTSITDKKVYRIDPPILSTSVPTEVVASGLVDPTGIDVDLAGNIYVVDTGNNSLHQYDNSGTLLDTWTHLDKPATTDPFVSPSDVAVDSTGNIFVADTGKDRIVRFDSVTGNGSEFASTVAFSGPQGIAVGADGAVFVADTNNHVVRTFDNAGNAGAIFGTVGSPGNSATQFNFPIGVAVDANQNIYVAQDAATGGQFRKILGSTGETLIEGLPVIGTFTDVAVARDFRIVAALTWLFPSPGGALYSFGRPADPISEPRVFELGNVTFPTANKLSVTIYAHSQTVPFDYAKFTLDYDSSCLSIDESADFANSISVLWPGGGAILRDAQVDDGADFDIDDPSADRHLIFHVSEFGQPLAAGTRHAIANVTFDIVGPLEGCTIRFDDSFMREGRETNTVENSATGMSPIWGTFYDLEEICEERKIEGSTLYWSNGNDVADVTVKDTSTASISDISLPKYELTYPLADDLLVQVTAERNKEVADDLALTSNDLIKVLNYIDDMVTNALTEEELRAADVSLSGGVTPLDATYISQTLVFLDDAANNTGAWAFNFTPAPIVNAKDNYEFLLGCTATLPIAAYYLGDVDGSWPTQFPKPQKSPRVDLQLVELEQDGDMVTVSMLADPLDPLRSLLFSMHYDPSIVSYEGMQEGKTTSEWYVLDNAQEPGTVHGLAVGWKNATMESGEVLAFRFRALDGGSEPQITFSRLLINDQESSELPGLTLRGDNGNPLPTRYSVRSWPNPFNPQTTVEYTVPQGAGNTLVDLRIYDVSGRLVRTLDKSTRAAGRYAVTWNGLNESGQPAGTGVYMLRINAGDWSDVEKLMLVK